MYFIFTDAASELGERYFVGHFTKLGSPSLVVSLSLALAFPTARQAYDHAGEEAKFCRALQTFKVGRRPNPVNLRSLIN